MSEGPSSNGVQADKTDEMSIYKKEALKVVSFKLVYDKDDLESENVISFKPEMAHQVFGESESIFGYRSLSITLNYLHNSCRCYLDIESSGKINNDHMKADNIMKSLNNWLPTNFSVSYDDFMDMIDEENHEQMYGTLINSFEDEKNMQRFPTDHIKATYRITQNDVSDESFRDFHSRFETFIVWFIDAANFIDLEDERWLIFYVYEEYKHPQKKKIYRSPVGFCTVYKFYAFPSNIRARISQFFILPSHQKRGIGTALYQAVAKTLKDMGEVIDITVEEPTSAFQKIRDLDDCLLIHNELANSKSNFFTTSSKRIFEMSKNNKIGKRQCQRVYDILGLYYASEKGTLQYKKFLESIKNRISEESERESRPGKRFCNLDRTGISRQVDKKAQIESEYKRHTEDIEPSVKYLQSKLKGIVVNGFAR